MNSVTGHFARCTCAILLLGLGAAAASAQQRVGLVIANQSYGPSAGGKLPLAAEGAKLVSSALARAGFAVLDTPANDADLQAMRNHVADFAKRVALAGPGAVSLLYFAGHGISGNHLSYLLPVKVEVGDLNAPDKSTLPLAEIIATLQREAPLAEHIIVVDACRAALKLGAAGDEAFSSGHADTSVDDVPPGFLVAFSTRAGAAAEDSTVFARELATSIVAANTSAEIVLSQLANRVFDATKGQPQQQLPQHINHLRREVFLGGKVEAVAPPGGLFEVTNKLNVLFNNPTVTAHERPDAGSAVVEIRALGAVHSTARGDDILLVSPQPAASNSRWISYQSHWGRVYVAAENVKLF